MVLDVQQLGNFVPFSDPNLFAKLFPHLFPFGYGHPGAERKVEVSLEQCIKHYLSIYSRRFAQDDTFPLIAFDIVSRKRAMGQNSLMCKINPKEMANCESVTAAQFLALNQKHNWRHVPSCFNTSKHVTKGNCRYNFPRIYIRKMQRSPEMV